MFSKKLKTLREENSLSMDVLVELYNKRFNARMNKSTLSRYENGTQEPIYTVVINLAKFFNVSVDYLTCADTSGQQHAKHINLTFGSKLKDFRKKAGLTQSDLASKLNLSKSNISKYESGEIQPSLQTLAKLSDIFETSVDYLLENDKEIPTVNQLSSAEQQLIDNYRCLNAEGQEKLLDLSTDLVSSGRYIKSAFPELDSKKA